MSTELRIKLAHIGMEPAIIKIHEQRIKNKLAYLKRKSSNVDTSNLFAERQRLIQHRRWNVRNDARSTHLALGFLTGMPYESLEINCEVGKRNRHIYPKVCEMVFKYGPDETKSTVARKVADWIGM